MGLLPDISDAELWHVCQAQGLVLFTANRNDEGCDSLESTIDRYNQETSLPVVTLANPIRFGRDREYAAKVADRALVYLLEMENHCGTGRIYV
ncbi:MAG: ACP S-malonyltransferase [Planctomycetota bacterium]